MHTFGARLNQSRATKDDFYIFTTSHQIIGESHECFETLKGSCGIKQKYDIVMSNLS